MGGIAQQALLMANNVPPAVITLTQQDSSPVIVAGPNTRTLANWAAGAAASDRVLYGLVCWDNGAHASTARALASATIGGVTASIINQFSVDNGFEAVGAAIIAALVPAGTLVNVVLNWVSGASYYRSLVALYAVTGLTSPITPLQSYGTYTLSTLGHSENLNVLGGGVTLSANVITWDTTSLMSGITRDFNSSPAANLCFEGGQASNSVSNVSYPVGITVPGPSTANMLMVGASFR